MNEKQQDEELQALIKGYTDKKKLTKEEEESLAILRKEYDQLQVTQKAETDALLKKQAEDKVKKDAEDAKKAKEDRENAVKEEYEKNKGYVDEYYKARETALVNADLSEKELADATAQLELERLEAQKKAAQDYGQSIVDIDNEIAKKKKENRDKEREETIANLQAAYDVGASLAQGLMDLDKARTDAALANANLTEEERERIAKESFERQKKLQYAMAVIDAAKAVTSIIAQYPKFDGGFAMTAALITTGITTALNIAKIASTQYQSKSGSGAKTASSTSSAGSRYANGGILGGPSHDLGGIKTVMGELEGGEFVVNRRATMNFLPLLNEINNAGRIPGPEVSNMQQPQVIKTYVVASDMTSQQEANAKISQMARLD